jgi:hypothetical protein
MILVLIYVLVGWQCCNLMRLLLQGDRSLLPGDPLLLRGDPAGIGLQ